MRKAGTTVFLACALALALAVSPLTTAEQDVITLQSEDDAVVLTLDLNQGDLVDYSWSADASLDFRVENVTGDTKFIDRSGQVGSGTFEVPADGTYTFEFRNRNDFAVTLEWTIDRRTEFPLPLFLSILIPVIAVAILVAVFLLTRRRRPPSS